jgi:hypothetical protein
MSVRYEEKDAPRFSVDTLGGYEQITLRARRNAFVMTFLIAWLGGWTFGAISAVKTLILSFQPFVAFWLLAWVVGGMAAAISLAWQFSGSEGLRVIGSDLEISYRMLGMKKRRLFRGSDIRNLSTHEDQALGRYGQMSLPFFPGNKSGCLKFSYGARTIYVGAGYDEAEGQFILNLLRKRLPATAVKPQ